MSAGYLVSRLGAVDLDCQLQSYKNDWDYGANCPYIKGVADPSNTPGLEKDNGRNYDTRPQKY